MALRWLRHGRVRRKALVAFVALSLACLAATPLASRGLSFLGLRAAPRSLFQSREAQERLGVQVLAAAGEIGGGQVVEADDELDPSRAAPSTLDISAVTSLVNGKLGVPAAVVPAAEGGGEPVSDVLEMQILRAKYWEEVVALVDRAETLKVAHIVAACRRLAFQVNRLDEEVVNDRRFQNFAVQAELTLAQEKLGSHTVSSLLWSISILRYPLPQLLSWLPHLHVAFPRVAAGMSLQNLTNSLSAIAKLERSVPQPLEVVTPILEGIENQVDDMQPAHVAATIWSLGELEVRDQGIYDLTAAVLDRLSLETLRDFSSKELSNLAWGLAQVGERDERVLRDIATVVVEAAPTMTQKAVAFDIPKLLCAFARLRYEDHDLIDAAAEMLLQRGSLRRVNHWGIAALKWSWPEFHEELPAPVRRISDLLEAQVGKRRLTKGQVERARMGPQEWSM